MVKTKKRSDNKSEFARRGHALYVRRIRPKLANEKKGRVVAVDVKSGDYEVDDDALVAADRLLARHPKVQIWFERVGFRTMVRIGAWSGEGSEK